MDKGFKITSRIEARYQCLEVTERERAKVLSFGMFFCVATGTAILAGIESARHLGPIAGSIAGIELGGILAGAMRNFIDRLLG